LALPLALALGACAIATPPPSPALPHAVSRQPLGALAVEVGQRLNKGVVLGAPALHDLPITAYIPADASDAQVVEILRAVLQGHDLTLTERQAFWLIELTAPASPSPADGPLRQTPGGVLIDLDQARLVDVTRTLSQLGGQQFLIAPELTEHRVTIQALRPVTHAEALTLLVEALTLDGILVQRRDAMVLIGVTPPPPVIDDHDGPVIPARPGKRPPQPPRSLPETVP
jgi:hypothetical protein